MISKGRFDMKRLFICIVTLFCGLMLSYAHAQQSYNSYTATATGPSIGINQTTGGINYHLLTWTGSGTRTSCTVALDSSVDGVTWTSGGAISGQNCAANGNSTVVAGTFNYVRINVTALTGAGNTVNVVYDGYTVNPSGGGLLLQTNGTNNGSQSKLNLTGGTNVTITDNGSGTDTITASSTAATAFSALTGATNTSAAMVVGTGASLAASGTGTIAATSVPAAGLGAGTISNATSGNAGTATACATTDGCWPKNGDYGTPTSLVLTNASGLPSSALPALPWVCSSPGLGDGLNAITAGTYLQTNCYNGTGHTVTITGILCFSDNAGTSTMNVTNGAGTDLLTGAVTCSASFAAGTQGATTTIASGDYVKFTFISDGSTKQTSWVIKGAY
jgi:hypothetical protein